MLSLRPIPAVAPHSAPAELTAAARFEIARLRAEEAELAAVVDEFDRLSRALLDRFACDFVALSEEELHVSVPPYVVRPPFYLWQRSDGQVLMFRGAPDPRFRGKIKANVATLRIYAGAA